ncbi:MAG TPA: endonuclease/exonuclease/phosphatase [Rhodospirillaceae bacterium]|nr:endonuclease/exonuclease/phosphatase [Rhodospirillaceae bacterium]
MAKRFSAAQWKRINALLDENPQAFGMPEGGREESLVLGSFNIRKLSSTRSRQTEIAFMARFCARCDLLAIQEIQDNLEGLHLLIDRMNARVAGRDEFGLVVSDTTGKVPGKSGMAERLAFIYRKHRIRRMDMASDITIDRSAVYESLFRDSEAFTAAYEDYRSDMDDFLNNERSTKPTFRPPNFVNFIRTPHTVAFEIPAANDAPPITFTAVNAHLIYGKMTERLQEFDTLMSWLANRGKNEKKMVAPNILLLGDLNLDFNKPSTDRPRIDKQIKTLNKDIFGRATANRIYFPFIDKHHVSGKYFRTTARYTETYDQIGFFLGKSEKRLPNPDWQATDEADGFDYGVFNFVDLFSKALKNRVFSGLSATEKDYILKHCGHSVSDHMPIWTRIPRPGF